DPPPRTATTDRPDTETIPKEGELMPPPRSRGRDAGPKPPNDAYTVLLTLSLLAMSVSCLLLYLDSSSYPEGKPPKPPEVSPSEGKPKEATPPEGGAAPGTTPAATPMPSTAASPPM